VLTLIDGSVQTTHTGWEAANDGGFLLFKNVPGDFQISRSGNNIILTRPNMPGVSAELAGALTTALVRPFGGKPLQPPSTLLPVAERLTNHCG